MPTLNVCVQIYMNKKTEFLFFSEALPMYNNITNENTDNSGT